MPNKIKGSQKGILENQNMERMDSVKFSFKWFGPFAVHSMSNKNLFSLINKDGTLIKTKCNVSFLKTYLDSDETKLTCDENLPSQCNRQTTIWYWKRQSSRFNRYANTYWRVDLTIMRSSTYTMKSLKWYWLMW